MQVILTMDSLHRKKSFSIFQSTAGMSLTKLSLCENYDVIYKLFLPRESLVSDIPAGDGNIEKLFLRCILPRLPDEDLHIVGIEFENI